jgi:hypothetical protein
MATIDIAILNPGSAEWEMNTIPNTLEAFQQAIGDDIELLHVGSGCIYVSENGAELNLPPCCTIERIGPLGKERITLVGPVIAVCPSRDSVQLGDSITKEVLTSIKAEICPCALPLEVTVTPDSIYRMVLFVSFEESDNDTVYGVFQNTKTGRHFISCAGMGFLNNEPGHAWGEVSAIDQLPNPLNAESFMELADELGIGAGHYLMPFPDESWERKELVEQLLRSQLPKV